MVQKKLVNPTRLYATCFSSPRTTISYSLRFLSLAINFSTNASPTIPNPTTTIFFLSPYLSLKNPGGVMSKCRNDEAIWRNAKNQRRLATTAPYHHPTPRLQISISPYQRDNPPAPHAAVINAPVSAEEIVRLRCRGNGIRAILAGNLGTGTDRVTECVSAAHFDFGKVGCDPYQLTHGDR